MEGLELGKTKKAIVQPSPTPQPQLPAPEPEPQPEAPAKLSWEEEVKKQTEELEKLIARGKPGAPPPMPPPKPKPVSQNPFTKNKPPIIEVPKTPGIAASLSNPKLSQPSRNVVQKLTREKPTPFQMAADQYGKAIAESILVQSEAQFDKRVNFEDEMRKIIKFEEGSYGLIYKGNTPLRLAPFVWQLDQGTRKTWAVFTFNNFYGHNLPSKLKHPVGHFRQRMWTTLVLTPFDNGSNMVDDYGKGYLVKFDERTQFQMPINVQDTAEAEKMRVDNKHFISAGLMLWMDLQAYTKAKLNMKMIMYLIIGAGIIVFAYWFISSHPGFLSAWLPKGL